MEIYEGTLYLENLVNKARVVSRRRMKFDSSQNGYHNHLHNIYYPNSSNDFCDEESCDGKRTPKYWHGNRPQRPKSTIKTANQFRDALMRVFIGERNPGDYTIDGPNIWRERMDAAKYLRSREVVIDLDEIAKASTTDLTRIREECPKRLHKKGENPRKGRPHKLQEELSCDFFDQYLGWGPVDPF